MLLVLSSVTDSLVNVATHLIRDIGLGGVGLLTMTSGVIGVPGTEPTMLFAGFNVFQGHLTLFGIIVFGLLGDLLGATIAYGIGYVGSRELFERQGSKFHMSAQRLDRAHGWFMRHGVTVVVVSRLIPFARAAFPYAAGVARMPYGRFIALATLGSIPWIAGLGILGRAVGSSWQSWRHNLEYVDYVGLVIVVSALAFVIVRLTRDRGDGPTPNVAS